MTDAPTPPVRLYLAGPMSGFPRFNFDAFASAAAQLREAGFEVWSPAEYDLEHGFDPDSAPANLPREEYAQILAKDLQKVCEVDGVALLPRWYVSPGARAEAAVADAIGIPALTVETWLAAVALTRAVVAEAA